MTLLQGILLGAIQGIAEFLPISSSGHLNIAQKLLNLEDVPLLFDVLLHIATLLVVVIFFRKKIWELLKAFGRLISRRPAPTNIKDEKGNVVELSQETALAAEQNRRRYILAVILTTIVTGIIGIASDKLIGNLPVRFIFIGFIITSAFLILAAVLTAIRQKKNPVDDGKPFKKAPTWIQSLIIGVAQGIGTLPGISRSGSTIAGAIASGVDRNVAGEYSFIASIPAVLGAFILEAKDIGDITTGVGIAPLIAGCLTAFATGYLALFLLIKIIKKGHLEWFAYYLIPAAILGLIFIK